MSVVLYSMKISHPAQVVCRTLDLKRVDYRRVDISPGYQRIVLPLAGFTAGTVPALKLDGRRVQGSRAIVRAIDERWPEPPLFPAEPALRAAADEAERWGEEQLQPIPRRLLRYGLATNRAFRVWWAAVNGIPAPKLSATAFFPACVWYQRTLESDGRRATEAGVRADLAALPALLAHADSLLADGTLSLDPANAAALQVLASVNLLGQMADLTEVVSAHACARRARELFPEYRGHFPSFLDPGWLSS